MVEEGAEETDPSWEPADGVEADYAVEGFKKSQKAKTNRECKSCSVDDDAGGADNGDSSSSSRSSSSSSSSSSGSSSSTSSNQSEQDAINDIYNGLNSGNSKFSYTLWEEAKQKYSLARPRKRRRR